MTPIDGARRSILRRWAINRRTREFHAMFAALPREVRRAARQAFRQFLRDPHHLALRLHELKATRRGRHQGGSWSVSITMKYRAIYVPVGGVNLWYWIGTHSNYDSFIGRK